MIKKSNESSELNAPPPPESGEPKTLADRLQALRDEYEKNMAKEIEKAPAEVDRLAKDLGILLCSLTAGVFEQVTASEEIKRLKIILQPKNKKKASSSENAGTKKPFELKPEVEKKVLDYLKAKGSAATSKEIEDACGTSINTGKVMAALKALGKVERKKVKTSVYWTFVKF